jgi:hypothetical protein
MKLLKAAKRFVRVGFMFRCEIGLAAVTSPIKQTALEIVEGKALPFGKRTHSQGYYLRNLSFLVTAV